MTVLTDAETKYLRTIIEPYKDRVKNVKKAELGNGECLKFAMKEGQFFWLPYILKTDKMQFSGMKVNKIYTMEDLGI